MTDDILCADTRRNHTTCTCIMAFSHLDNAAALRARTGIVSVGRRRTATFSPDNAREDLNLQTPRWSCSFRMALSLSTLTSAMDNSITSGSIGQETYDMILPDPYILWSMSIVTILCVVVVLVWSQQVVPISRTKLALSKRSGSVREYLDQLKDAVVGTKGLDDDSTGVIILPSQQTPNTTTFSVKEIDLTNVDHPTVAIASDEKSSLSEQAGDTSKNISNRNNRNTKTRALERWLFTDWLRQRDSKSRTTAGRQKEPALPILKSAKWNSGDNPVLVTTALILTPVLLTSTFDYLRHWL